LNSQLLVTMAPSAVSETVPIALEREVKSLQSKDGGKAVRAGVEKSPLEAISHGIVMPGR
jgi:hypothetical protein